MCNGTVNVIAASDKINRAFEKMARRLYEDSIEANAIDVEMYDELNHEFMRGVNTNYKFDFEKVAYNSTDLLAYQKMMANIYAFSGAKTFAQLIELRNLIRDSEGNIRPFSEFKEDALKINDQYNINWLNTEYNNAVNSSIAAANWQRQIQDSDLFPYLVYQTVGDSNVREEHQRLDGIKRPIDDAFWNTHYPPNDWGCRCEAISDGDPEGLTDPDETSERAAGAIRNKMFRNNPGKTGIIFKDNHPYFKVADKAPSLMNAVENYGLRELSKIYQGKSKLKKPAAEFQSKEAFEKWWTSQVDNSDVKEGFVINDSSLKMKLVANEVIKAKLLKTTDYKRAKEIVSIVESANEVYAVQETASTLKTVYIKFYNDQPMIVITQVNNRKKTVEIIDFKQLPIDKAEAYRNGILLKRI